MSNSTPSSTVSLSLRTIAVSCVLVALASLATLVVVVSVKGIDALSTLALALAVLAFVVQLIVFIVQAADASQQTARNQELHARMMSALAQIQERTQGTQQSVDRMNTRLLEAVIGKATGEGLVVGSSEFVDRLATGIGGQEAGSELWVHGDDKRASKQSRYANPLPSTEAQAIHLEMATWPERGQLDEVKSLTKDFSSWDWDALYRLAFDTYAFTRPYTAFGPGLEINVAKFRELGLSEKLPGRNLYVLTEKGRLVGRLMTAQGEAPPELAEYATIRAEIEKLRRQKNLRVASDIARESDEDTA